MPDLWQSYRYSSGLSRHKSTDQQIILNTLPVTSVVISVLKALEGMCTVILEYHVYHIPAGSIVLMT